MENIDVMVLRQLCAWRKAAKHALLCTVVQTWGSSPRPVGSIMALCEDGSVVGSVSGGCIEDDLIARYGKAGAIKAHAPEWIKYGISADEAHRFGLPCGGTLQLLLEFNPDVKSLETLVASLARGQLMERQVLIQSGAVSLHETSSPSELSLSHNAQGEEVLSACFGPEFRMLLIGAGQLSEYLATMALFSGFAVTVCDPREEYARGWSVKGVTLDKGMPDDVVAAFKPDARSAVVALTHDPKLDDLALLEAINSAAFYVGAIGSRRNSESRRSRMVEHFEATEAQLQRLHGPIGIYIGSKTPAEIAVSTMAQILAVKNHVTLPEAALVANAKSQISA